MSERRERVRKPQPQDRQAEGEIGKRILDGSRDGAPLDGGVQHRLESSLGHDLSDVRVHTGGEADTLARALDAMAFTTGRDIFFREGAYAPSTPGGMRLLAHEATHTAQQSAGPVAGTPVAGGITVSDPQDTFEHEADRAADRVGSRDSALGDHATSSGHDFSRLGFDARDSAAVAVQRQPTATKEKEKRGPTGHVGGETDSMTFLQGAGDDVLAPGEAGYSIRMLEETGAAAEKKTGLYADSQLHNVVPSVTEVEKQLKQRAVDKQRALDEVSGWAGPSTNNRYTETADWCQRHMEHMEADRSAEQEKCAQYNAWVPRANGFFTAVTRLEAMQEMLGVKDPNAMASALTEGLRDAQAIGERAQFAHAGGKGENLDVPAVDETLTDLSNQTTLAGQELNTAWLGFQQNALADRATETNAEGDADRKRMGEINEVKQFVRNVGKVVDTSMSVVSGAPAAIGNATAMIKKGEATIGAYRNKKQIMAGERPTHNPTYVTVNEKGDMIVRNVQTGSDRPIEGGESTPTPEVPFALPTSVSDLLGTITDFAYSGEVREINMRLEAIKSRCDAINGVAELLKIRERAQNFQDKLNAFALKCNQLQNRMAQRRQTYLQFGIELDNFARRDATARAAGNAPKGGEERYATIMTVAAQVREVLAVGTGARDGFLSSANIATWAQDINARRSETPIHNFYRDGKYYPEYFKLPDTEWKPLERMYGQVKTFEANVGMLEGIFKDVEAQARTLMGALNRGGGSAAY